MIVDAAFRVHMAVGPGLFESVYEALMEHELKKLGLRVERQVMVPLEYEGLRFDEAFRADMIVDERIIVELKSVVEVHPIYKKQLLTYLKLTGLSLGLLINFGADRIKDGVFRVANQLKED
ncbi:MAG: GxxExxY protein [Verrucomicrobiaceae bacterium]|nr:GxxExxY protein [Verrucomicrobiaceae bacterium]